MNLKEALKILDKYEFLQEIQKEELKNSINKSLAGKEKRENKGSKWSIVTEEALVNKILKSCNLKSRKDIWDIRIEEEFIDPINDRKKLKKIQYNLIEKNWKKIVDGKSRKEVK